MKVVVVMFGVTAGGLMVAGCIGPQEMAQRHRATCDSYGFTPGTQAYANCLLQLDVGDYGYSHHGRRKPWPHGASVSPPLPSAQQ